MNACDKEDSLTLEILEAIEESRDLSQRHLAQRMGVALGLANSYLANSYLKCCVRKGLVKIQQAPANRYLYYLTPKGFAEKSRLTARCLSMSFTFYRLAGDSCADIFHECARRGWWRSASTASPISPRSRWCATRGRGSPGCCTSRCAGRSESARRSTPGCSRICAIRRWPATLCWRRYRTISARAGDPGSAPDGLIGTLPIAFWKLLGQLQSEVPQALLDCARELDKVYIPARYPDA